VARKYTATITTDTLHFNYTVISKQAFFFFCKWVRVVPRDVLSDILNSKVSGVQFYRFPVEVNQRNLWISVLRREKWRPGEHDWLYGLHFVSGLGLASSSASFASAFGGTPTVKKEKLKIVVGDNSYQINNKYDHKYRPLPAKEIVEAALSRVGQKVDYDVFTNNCEHFVTLLRYGEPDSEQLFMSTDPGWRSLYRRNVGTIKKRRKTFLFTSWTHRKA
uniref:Retinoic acid receptor responder 3 n=1 Tax=Eptatretus burgeri TaxID=7764 RepID=A0A8C4N7X9_EPTBU